MTTYKEVKLNISDNQKDKIQHAIKNKIPVTIRISEIGDDILALSQRQINKLDKAFAQNKGADITLSKKQMRSNLKIEGGFLPALAAFALPLLKTAVPAIAKSLGIGALTGLASTGVQKLMGNGTTMGDGLYLSRGGYMCQIETDGKGLYLTPYQGSPYGDGLYLAKGGQLYDGSGFLGDLVKNIPILNLLL